LSHSARYCDFVGAGAAGGGVSGWVDDEPEPVVAGGMVRGAELLVVVPEEPLLAVLLLLFQPATIKKPISSSTATPAIQPHIPPVLSSRRTTGSLNRGSGSFNRGSVKRGSVMTSSLFGTLRVVSNKGNPTPGAPVPNKQRRVRELQRSGHADRESPGRPEDKEETGEKDRQTGGLRPNFDGPANEVGEALADQDENHVKHYQFHGGVPQTPLRGLRTGSAPT
jgi:hypothetical protein